MSSLQGKVALVTGAGRGIGRAIALELASHGAAVVVNDIGAGVKGEGNDESVAQSVVKEIEQAGGQAIASTELITTWDGARQIVDAGMKAFGKLDIVVNNAGILRDRMFFNMDPDDWKAVIDVHVNGSFFISRAAAPAFRQQEGGSYIHFTSTSGLIGNLGQANYGAAKMAIVGMSKNIALDMKKFNVRSNCVSPFAWTRMIASIPTETPEQQERVRKLKEMSPEKIATLVAFLGSDEAKEITGQVFAVRNNEVFLMSQSRPLRSMQRSTGWKMADYGEHMLPAFRSSFYPLDVSADVFCWDPI